MNRKFALTLISSPALFASMISLVMMTSQPARANQPVNGTGNFVNCVEDPHSADHNLVCQRASKKAQAVTGSEVTAPQAEPSRVTELQFTDEESDAAIAMFGCDCPVCINALRQLRGDGPIPV